LQKSLELCKIVIIFALLFNLNLLIMSHFTVLVIGQDPDTQLAPYDENREVDEYECGEVSEHDKDRFVNYYTQEHPEVATGKTFDELYPIYGESWDSGRCRKDENGVWREYSTYNPDSKWDWYVIGGRWTGFFKLKSGAEGEQGEPGLMTPRAEEGTADHVLKGDVDFKAMEDEARAEALAHYDKVMAIIGEFEPNRAWEDILAEEQAKGTDIEVIRDIYWKQPRCKAYKEDKDLGWGDPDRYLIPREKYGENAANSSCVPYAFVKDGKWFGRGDMGWWGMSSNEKDQDEWNKQVHDLLVALPDDTELWLVDCHI
jgi:hypothetical protein